MSFSVHVIKDTISPKLAKLIRECSNPRKVLEAMGLSLVSSTKRAFNDQSLRPLPWPELKKSSGAPLKKSGALRQSPRVTETTSNSVTVGTDRPYAVYHQFGTGPYVIRPTTKKALFWPGARHPVRMVNHPGLPARPFFPFDASGKMIPAAMRLVEAAANKALSALLKQ